MESIYWKVRQRKTKIQLPALLTCLPDTNKKKFVWLFVFSVLLVLASQAVRFISGCMVGSCFFREFTAIIPFEIREVRVSPLKFVSIPRLELVAATLSVKIVLLLREELDIEINKEYFWTDSKVLLGHISNSSKRFKIFVANRIKFIFWSFGFCTGALCSNCIHFSRYSSRGLDAIKSSK